MAGKLEMASDTSSTGDPMGGLDSPWTRLDQDRAASMADEGGASGAYIEAEAEPPALIGARARPRWLSVLGWGAFAAGCAVLAGRLLRRAAR